MLPENFFRSLGIVIAALIVTPAFTQVKTYSHTDGGIISPVVLSFIDFSSNPNDVSNKPRCSFFFHFGEYYDIDLNNTFGFFTGATMLNIGFTAKNENVDIEKRFRTYALGVPIAVKLGSFKDDFYIYGGGEYQLFFHYKEKTYIAGEKSKSSEWFSNKTPLLMPSVFFGIQFPKDWTVKFQYQMDDFLKPEKFNPQFSNNALFGIPTGQLFWISVAKTNFEKMLKKKSKSNTQNAIFTYNE